MKLRIIEDAEAELVSAACWYETHEVGLGVKFRDEIAGVLVKVGETPFLWRELHGGYRRVNYPVFPYLSHIVLSGVIS